MNFALKTIVRLQAILFVAGLSMNVASAAAHFYQYDFNSTDDTNSPDPNWTTNLTGDLKYFHQPDHGHVQGDALYGAATLAYDPGDWGAATMGANQSFDLSNAGDSLTFSMLRFTAEIEDSRDVHTITNPLNEITQVGFVDSSSTVLGQSGNSVYVAAVETGWDKILSDGTTREQEIYVSHYLGDC